MNVGLFSYLIQENADLFCQISTNESFRKSRRRSLETEFVPGTSLKIGPNGYRYQCATRAI